MTRRRYDAKVHSRNCPECGRFMSLGFAGEVCANPPEGGAAYFWYCTNHDWCIQASRGDLVPEHRYDWWYWCSTIPQGDLDEWPELAAECHAMGHRYGKTCPRPRYVYLLRAL